MNNNNNVEMSLNTNPEEETKMLEQVQRFNDIAKQIEEIDAVGGDVYVGGVKVSWEAVKQFIYGLDDEELKLLAYSNKSAIPAELEAYAIYLLEAEKAWDNELTMQNSYFNSKKHLSMDLQFFASKSEEEMKMKNEREIESLLSEYFQEEVSLISKQEELVKLHEQTWKESVRKPRVKLGVSTKNKTNKKKEEIKMNKMSKKNARKVIYVIALVLIVVFAEEWFNIVDMLIPKSSMDGAEIFLVAPLWLSSYMFLAVQSFRWIGGFLITLVINIKELFN